MRGLFVYTPILKVHITTPTGTHHRHPTVPRVSGARHRHVDQIGFSSERPHQMGTPKCTPGGGTLGEESVSLKLTRLMSLGLCPGDLILPLMFFMPLVPAEKNMGHQNGFRKGVKTPLPAFTPSLEKDTGRRGCFIRASPGSGALLSHRPLRGCERASFSRQDPSRDAIDRARQGSQSSQSTERHGNTSQSP